MGFVLGKLFVLPTKDGHWVVVFGNGDFTGTTSKLFMVDLENPSTATKIIDTTEGTGLSSPAVVLNSLGQLESAYAGDVDGNMWHFYYDGSVMKSYKVFATQSGQTITAAPTIGYNDLLSKYMVYFGTGRYYKLGDNNAGAQQQSFYAVADLGAGAQPPILTQLFKKEMTTDYDSDPKTRSITGSPNWDNDKGWYIDLDNTGRNERVISKALLLQDKLLITTLMPTSVPCDVGGKSWFMEIPAVGDKYTDQRVADLPKFEDQIYLGDTNVSIKPVATTNTSSSSSAGSSSSSSSSDGSNCGKKTSLSLIKSGTSGGALTVTNGELDACGTGRQAWRQLR
jgi:type IV pilus assembly protein PilY1